MYYSIIRAVNDNNEGHSFLATHAVPKIQNSSFFCYSQSYTFHVQVTSNPRMHVMGYLMGGLPIFFMGKHLHCTWDICSITLDLNSCSIFSSHIVMEVRSIFWQSLNFWILYFWFLINVWQHNPPIAGITIAYKLQPLLSFALLLAIRKCILLGF